MRNRFFQFSAGLTAFYLIHLVGCTENPFTENKISLNNRQISGSVELANAGSPEDVFVWLDGFDFQTKTDKDGRFKLILPPKAAQANSNGITGAFNLYFYVSNFKIESLKIQLERGEVIYPADVFNREGEFHRPILLSQLLNVNTIMFPDTIVVGQEGLMRVSMLFETTQSDTVRALFPSKVGTRLFPIIFQNIETNEVQIFESTIVGIPPLTNSDTLKVTSNRPVETSRIIRANASDFDPGMYRVIPFITVLQDGVPQPMLRRIGPAISQLGPGYLELPFFRQGGGFEVIAPIGLGDEN